MGCSNDLTHFDRELLRQFLDDVRILPGDVEVLTWIVFSIVEFHQANLTLPVDPVNQPVAVRAKRVTMEASAPAVRAVGPFFTGGPAIINDGPKRLAGQALGRRKATQVGQRRKQIDGSTFSGGWKLSGMPTFSAGNMSQYFFGALWGKCGL